LIFIRLFVIFSIDGEAFFHQSFVDVEPISGMAVRRALKLQLNFRIENNALNNLLWTGNSRCVNPRKSDRPQIEFGCFVFFPLVWWEDNRVIPENELRRFYHRYIMRRDRMRWVMGIGVVIPLLLVVWSIMKCNKQRTVRKDWRAKIYID